MSQIAIRTTNNLTDKHRRSLLSLKIPLAVPLWLDADILNVSRLLIGPLCFASLYWLVPILLVLVFGAYPQL